MVAVIKNITQLHKDCYAGLKATIKQMLAPDPEWQAYIDNGYEAIVETFKTDIEREVIIIDFYFEEQPKEEICFYQEFPLPVLQAWLEAKGEARVYEVTYTGELTSSLDWPAIYSELTYRQVQQFLNARI